MPPGKKGGSLTWGSHTLILSSANSICMEIRILVPVLVLAIATVCCGCTGTSSSPGEAPAATTPAPVTTSAPVSNTFSLHVGTLADGAALPVQYSCTGAGESPEISWTNVPNGTLSLALVMEDPDAPSGTFTHWILYNIPPNAKGIPAGISATKELDDGEKSGQNSAGNRGYYPPCPPVGSTHRYIFRLYALDQEIGIAYATRDDLDQVIAGHILSESNLTTTFGR